jgi:hypothetical protein
MKGHSLAADEQDRTGHDLGARILAALREVLMRSDEGALPPGEGRERAFRGWLMTDVFVGLLGWPAEQVVLGERFDLTLKDADGFPVVTVETKAPGHQATQQEHQDFEDRLADLGSLRTAYFTNGTEWERLDVSAPTGAVEVHGRSRFRLDDATAEEAEAFFAPAGAWRYFAVATRTARHEVSRRHPQALESLTADLHRTIDELRLWFREMLSGLREGRAGERPRGIALGLFDLWCEKSMTVSPRQAAERLVQRLRRLDGRNASIDAALRDAGVPAPGIAAVRDGLAALIPEQALDRAAVAEVLWPAYASAAETLCAQTAHVVLARALLYRVGEDRTIFPRRLSGEGLGQSLGAAPPLFGGSQPATNLLAQVQEALHDFLPAVYALGEFDWWVVTPGARTALAPAERAWLADRDREFERAAQSLLRMLNGYFFGRVDVDVWRNVYQHYLPHEERQRLGGFYTPDELIDLILDLSEFRPETPDLCTLSFIDPSCGSGAFVANALARLLAHFDLDLPCHAEVNERGTPEWRRAEAALNAVARNLHAVDLHPFAAFLTTVNTLFLLMPLYMKAREHHRDFHVDLQVFSADSLEKHDRDLLEPDLFARLNSRVELTQESFRRYQEMLKVRFDRVFGNPPWGGVLKGPLAPVYDAAKKERFAREYPAAAQGKYDVFGLFLERAVQILKPGGRFGLLTQGTFIDKEWAAGLRKMLAARTHLRFIVDLNPFGQLFFRAMNAPCITVADALRDEDGKGACVAVLSGAAALRGPSREERRAQVVETVRQAVKSVSARRSTAEVGFARAARVPLARLRETAASRWDLAARPAPIVRGAGSLTAADVLEVRQGVTPGGCLDIFLLTAEEAEHLGLERDLVHPAVKSREIDRWRVRWNGRVLLYPYLVERSGTRPAFALDAGAIRDAQAREAVRRLGVADALDFDRMLDRREEEITHRRGVNRGTVGDLLKHRIALGLVRFPKTAAYLVQHYEDLEGRVFKQRNIRDFSRRWYEYLWPRDSTAMLSKRRILAPTLVKTVRFAYDSRGLLSDHACLFLQPATPPAKGFTALRGRLAAALGQRIGAEVVLKYCLAFLSSEYAQRRLVAGRRPTPRGYYQVGEQFLREVPIPAPRRKQDVSAILDAVNRLLRAKDPAETARLERDLAGIVDRMLEA